MQYVSEQYRRSGRKGHGVAAANAGGADVLRRNGYAVAAANDGSKSEFERMIHLARWKKVTPEERSVNAKRGNDVAFDNA